MIPPSLCICGMYLTKHANRVSFYLHDPSSLEYKRCGLGVGVSDVHLNLAIRIIMANSPFTLPAPVRPTPTSIPIHPGHTFRNTRYAGFLQSLLITLAGRLPPRSVCAYMVNSLLGRPSGDRTAAAAAAAAAAEDPPLPSPLPSVVPIPSPVSVPGAAPTAAVPSLA